ncbi:MAG: aminotransferase class V-fold PLP-dependent enzyme [Kordiimonadaceae bacterium]|nr:aminotransferase class V-fold PLP-dependent enzyme [Kordiimonadaceae bacterium]MBO6570542.1 aminotransferase class V-fold PLP-dependent enzyme [Kordiimonadaceae bacterium]MBO6966339.1 aminotransferase class V-fold PLP-dependent enzyme [Kordiimonadaceae bacterium]
MTTIGSSFSDKDLSRVREQTPGVSGRIHLDNCGSALMAQPVIDEISAVFQREIAVGGYVAQEQQADKLSSSYNLLAELFDGHADDFAFVGSAVDGWTKAFYSVPFEPGDNIVTAYNEYCSNYVAYLQVAKLRGVEIRVARQADAGGIDLNHLNELVDSRTRLISISHMPSSSGEINQVQDVGLIAREKGVLYQLDACQSAGHIPVSIADIGCDIMTGTSRKFLRGPRGIGFLYVNEKARSLMEPVVLTNQSAEWSAQDAYSLRQDTKVFEAWERSVTNQLGFAVAIQYLLDLGVEKATNQIANNATYLRKQLPNVKGVRVECPPNAVSAIITLNKDGLTPSDIKSRLEKQAIGVQVASVVHTRLDLEARGIESAVRVSPHYYTSQSDMDGFLNALEAL